MSSHHGRDSWQGDSRGEGYGNMKTDGMNVQGLPLTGVKGKKKICYITVHPTFMNHRKPKVSKNCNSYLKQ